jgi:hypothetical protein
MIIKTEKIESIKDFFNEGSTTQFLKEIDLALRNVNLEAIKKVFKDYGIYHLESSQDFIGHLHYQFLALKKDGMELVVLPNAKPRLSKCMGCSFGSTIKAFKYEYKKRHIYGSGKTEYYDVVYEKEFGVLLKIENKILTDIGVCNAFLSEQECKELNH